jgi:hypothetical protein
MKTHPHHIDYDITEDGKVFSRKRNRFMTPTLDKNGYYRLSIYVKGEGTKTLYVHKLIAETYIINSNSYRFVAHIDGDRSNNTVSNLEWRRNSKPVTDADKTKEKKLILEYKKFLEEKGYIVLDQSQAQNIMKRIRQS